LRWQRAGQRIARLLLFLVIYVITTKILKILNNINMTWAQKFFEFGFPGPPPFSDQVVKGGPEQVGRPVTRC
jgi:hypothetical protein